jgi:NAD(P)-dependent dehydrogenase (short-subunit alcohol dehydrogenase family)
MTAIDHSADSLSDLNSLAGRVAVVTGGGRGIGRAIARRLGEAGATVYVADIDLSIAEAAATELSSGGLDVRSAHVDATDEASVASLATTAAAENGLHIWVNNAGIYPVQPLADLDSESWQQVISLNLSGSFYGAKAASDAMSGRGVIVNIASTAGQRPGMAGIVAYSSSKAAIEGLTKSLAQDLGARGIRVLAISPTMVLTEGVAAHQVFGQDEPQQMFADMLPLGRPALPDDIARAVVFCASDMSSFMTGSVLYVDGGHMTV